MPPKRKAEKDADESEESLGSEDSFSDRSLDEEEDEESLVSTDDGEEGESGDDDKEDGSDGDQEDTEKTIDVDFTFADPTEEDFQALKILLNSYCEGLKSNSDLVDAIITQASYVGTVIKVEGEDDVYAVGSALPLKPTEGDIPAYITEIRSFLTSSAPTDADKKHLEEAFAAEGAALLVLERIRNLAPQLALPLLEGVLTEIDEAELVFKSYLTIARVYEDPVKAGTYVHVTPDGEVIEKKAEWSFVVPLKNQAASNDELKGFEMVMFVNKENLVGAVEDLKALKIE